MLGNQITPRWMAPHFVWAVRDELATKLCGEDAPTCPELEHGGLRVTTTLDVELQGAPSAGSSSPHRSPIARTPRRRPRRSGSTATRTGCANLDDKNVRNGALVALDYETGEIVAYVGRADYYSSAVDRKFQPQYDVVGQGYRQPGSAFKPFNYAIGIDDRTITAGTS